MRNIITMAYRALDSENTGIETSTMRASTITEAVPTGMPRRRLRSWATMSVPPVLPPVRNTRPSPAPQTTPPHRAQSRRSPSPSGGTTGAGFPLP